MKDEPVGDEKAGRSPLKRFFGCFQASPRRSGNACGNGSRKKRKSCD